MRAIKNILLITTLLLSVWSCQEKVDHNNTASGNSSIVLHFKTDDGLTLKTKDTEQQEMDKGLLFDNVLVILIDNTNTVKGISYVSSINPDTDEQDVNFNNLLAGQYTAYAYANIDKTIWQNSSYLISSQEGGLSNGASFTSYINRELLQMTASQVPENPPYDPLDPSASLLLLTGKQSIEVGISEDAEATIELKRPVVRFKVSVNNMTNYPVTVNSLSFSHFNPDRTYLIERDDNGDGVPDIPAGTIYRPLPDFPILDNNDNPVYSPTVASGAEAVVYSTYLYENASPLTYKVNSMMTLTLPGDVTIPVRLGEKPFGPIDYNMLEAMDDGESVDVLIINPQINKRYGRLFCHINNNKLAWESVGYTEYDKLFARVKAIYDERANYDYGAEGYTPSSDKNSSYDGVNASTASTFNYTGAGKVGHARYSDFFRTISKSDGKYTINGLAIANGQNNTTTETSISNLIVEKGNYTYPQSNPKITSGLGNLMVKFKNASNQNQVLKVNADSETNTYLKWESNSAHQDRHFILFGKYCVGGRLNRILSGSNREVPLTYMARNEVINLVINVYYADTEGTLDFTVDNSTWSSQTTTSTHTFE